jgi:hypothetical protein
VHDVRGGAVKRKRIRVSHLTIAQAARFAEVKQPTARERLLRFTILEQGVLMVPADEVRRYWRERMRARRLGLPPTTPLRSVR